MTVEVRIRHGFGGFTLDAAFGVEETGVTALFGASGSGKTTTINAIAGLLRPDEGRIRINGEVVLDTAHGIFVPARRRGVGYVFQDGRLFPHMSVRANLQFGARRSRSANAGARLDEVVELLGVGHLLERRPRGLSGGERQRVALGRAILADARILLLDEPMATLDQARKAEIIRYLQRVRDEAGIPMIYVSHVIDEVTRLADQIVVLDQGRVVTQDSVFELMARLDLFPLTGRFEAGAVIAARVAAHDPADRLSALAFDRGRLWVPEVDLPVGAEVRIRVRARDVMLALEEPAGISANNVVAGIVTEIRQDEGPFVDVQLACGRTRLLARITRRSLARLELRPGVEVVAVIKSATADRRTLDPAPKG